MAWRKIKRAQSGPVGNMVWCGLRTTAGKRLGASGTFQGQRRAHFTSIVLELCGSPRKTRLSFCPKEPGRFSQQEFMSVKCPKSSKHQMASCGCQNQPDRFDLFLCILDSRPRMKPKSAWALARFSLATTEICGSLHLATDCGVFLTQKS